MSEVPVLATERLILRGWRDADREAFAALNADPEVMTHFPALLEREQSDQMIDFAMQAWEQNGFCWFAVQLLSGPFIGFAGLHLQTFTAPFTPAVEVGWRLARRFWGHGFATEAATAAIDWGFSERGLDRIVSFTVPANTRSRAVMTRLGMRHDPAGDFDHPRLPEGHPLRRHVLYSIDHATWAAQPELSRT